MEKRSLITIIISLMCTGILIGCGKSSDSSDISDKLKGKLAVVEKEQEADTPEPEKKEEKEAEKEAGKESEKAAEEEPVSDDTSKGVPGLLLFRQQDMEFGEGSEPVISHRYTYLLLDGESTKTYEGLAAALEDARDEILSKHKKTWDDDQKMIEENKLLTFDEGWMTYVRRADDAYLSFVTEYSGEGMFDDGANTSYTAHSYHVDSGKEIAFSDVVADEDAFYDLLSEKMYESINSKLQQYYSSDIGDDKETFRNDLKDYMRSGELAWTLDPFGVTCYLPAYTKAPFAESAVIQFSEDSAKVIFADDFRDSAKDEYVIQVPGYVGSYIDTNGSGVPAYVNVSEFYDYNETYDDMELSGLHISNGGEWKNIPTTMPGGTAFYNIFLLHKDDSTVVLENHDEYDTSFLNTYVLARKEVREAASARGCFEWADRKDYDINDEGYTPVYVPTDPSSIRALTGDGEYAQDWKPAVINVDANGNLKVS